MNSAVVATTHAAPARSSICHWIHRLFYGIRPFTCWLTYIFHIIKHLILSGAYLSTFEILRLKAPTWWHAHCCPKISPKRRRHCFSSAWKLRTMCRWPSCTLDILYITAKCCRKVSSSKPNWLPCFIFSKQICSLVFKMTKIRLN